MAQDIQEANRRRRFAARMDAGVSGARRSRRESSVPAGTEEVDSRGLHRVDDGRIGELAQRDATPAFRDVVADHAAERSGIEVNGWSGGCYPFDFADLRPPTYPERKETSTACISFA